VVVDVGATEAVPPVDDKVRLLPLVPSSVTEVALVACTVTVEELPEAIVVGLALTVTVGRANAAALTLTNAGETKVRSKEMQA
jgi:hypothetical protein